jgi:uncharacterized protein YbaP (TraB family)
MEKTFKILVVLGLLLTGCVHSDPAPPAGVSSLHTGPLKTPLLWEVTKGKDKSYLFGTVHVGVDADKDLPKSVWSAFSDSSCFVMEADQAEIDPRALMAMAKLPAGVKLSDKVSGEVWQKIRSELGSTMPEELLLRSEPWFVTIVYMQKHLPEGRAMDGVFQERAKALKKSVDYLEHWQEAIGAFARATDAKDLEDLVLHQDEAEEQMQDLVKAYATGDEKQVEGVLDAINAETPGGAAKMDVLLKERNDLWFPRLEKSLERGHCFVAVGAAHLVGKGSLRRRLEASGYAIRRIKSAEAPK